MVVLTIYTTKNPCTVFFDRPVPKADYIRLISCSFCNSWLNLKESGTMSLLSNHKVPISEEGFPPGHYTPKDLAKTLNFIFKKLGAKVTAEANSPTGAVVIENPEIHGLQFTPNLQDFRGVPLRLDMDAFISKLNVPSVFFVYCDLVDRDQNLLNGKKTSA